MVKELKAFYIKQTNVANDKFYANFVFNIFQKNSVLPFVCELKYIYINISFY